MKNENEKKSYVYLLIDPRDKKDPKVFYIGKGSGKRPEDHLKEKLSEKAKHQKIKEIQDSGHKVKIEFLRTGLTAQEALDIEAAAIDLLGKDNLTNLQLGHHHKEKGRRDYYAGVEKIKEKDLNKLAQDGPVLCVCLNKSYSYKLTPQELYDATRYSWEISTENRNPTNGIKYVLGVYYGIVKSIYIPVAWFKAGQTFPEKNVDDKYKKRWEFVGHMPEEKIQKKFLQKRIDIKFPQKGFTYWSVK